MVQSTGVAAALQPLAPVVQLPLTQSKAQAVQGTPLASAVPAPVPKGSPDVSAPMVGSTAPALQPLVPVAQVPLSFPQAKAPAVHGTPLASGVPTPVPKASQEVSKMREHKAVFAVLTAVQELANSTAESFEACKKKVTDTIDTEIEFCGAQTKLLKDEAVRVVEQTTQYFRKAANPSMNSISNPAV